MTELITGFLSVISSVFTTYLPAMAKGIADAFSGLFVVTTEQGAITGLNALGTVAVIIIAMGLVAGLVAIALGVLRVRRARKGKRKSKR